MVYEKIIWNDFSRSPEGVSLRDETDNAINNTGHFYDLLPCKSPFGPPLAFKNMSGTYFHVTRRALHKEVKCKFDPVKFSGNHASKVKQHSKKVNGGFHRVKEDFCFFTAMRA